MNKLLDLDEVVREGKRRDTQKLALFETILDQCHSQITRHNKEHRVKFCKFSVPLMVLGRPPYDFDVLINYLLYHLRDNGLYAEFLPDSNQIYISWHEDDMDLDKYQQRRDRIRRIVGTATVPTVAEVPPINRDKHSNARKVQSRRDNDLRREPTALPVERRDNDLRKSSGQPKSFSEFMRSW